MIETDLRSSFLSMARRYKWRLAPDEDAFVVEAMRQYEQVTPENGNAKRIGLAIKQAYSVRLYHGLIQREERAAAEIWTTIFQIARGKGWDEVTAQDIAQETVRTILDRLHTKLRAPETLLSWQFWVYRDVVQRFREAEAHQTTLTTHDDSDISLPDPVDMAEHAENRVVGERLMALLRQTLHEPYRTVLLRIVILDEKPRHVAQALGLSLSQVRMYKHRALARLRSIDEVRRLLQSLIEGDASAAEGT